MTRYLLTTAAKADLIEIYDYIRPDSPKAARRVLERIREAMRRLADNPWMGHVREELADTSLRFWSVYSYLIVYRPRSKPLEIIRVLHGARDVRRLLDQTE